MIVSRFDEQIERKSKLYGFLGTTSIGTILLVLLLFFYMPTIFLPEDEGILVSFGDSFDGGGTGGEYYGGRAGGGGETNSYATPEGRVEETNAPLPTQTTQTPHQSTSQPTNVATQDDPSAATIAQQKIEQQRLEQQRIAEEQKKILAEQQRVAAKASHSAPQVVSANETICNSFLMKMNFPIHQFAQVSLLNIIIKVFMQVFVPD